MKGKQMKINMAHERKSVRLRATCKSSSLIHERFHKRLISWSSFFFMKHGKDFMIILKHSKKEKIQFISFPSLDIIIIKNEI